MEKEVGIYISIDALFDTRLSTLYSIAKDSVPQILKESYFDRQYDEFKGVDSLLYNEAYEKRDIKTLHSAVITRAALMLMFFIDKTYKARASTPFIMEPVIHLNIHPYVLPENVIKTLIVGLKALTEGRCDIKVIDTPLSEITPSYVKDTYAMMVMYDYWNWLEVQSSNGQLASVQCPEVTLIGPAIVRSKAIFEEIAAEDPYTAIELYTSMFIKLKLYPISFFSVDLDRLLASNTPEKKDA